MTTVITRYFETPARARSAKRELQSMRFSGKIVKVYTKSDGLVEALTAAQVDPATAEAYEHRVAKGGAVVLVAAGIKPLSAARTAREVLARMGAVPLGNLPEEVFVADPPTRRSSVLTDHPHLLLSEKDPSDDNYHMADWPIPLISRRKPFNQMLIDPHGRMADKPLRLIIRKQPRDEFAFPRHARMADFLLPLTIRRKPSDNYAFPRHARMADWPIRLVSRRKPFAGTAIGKHTRMANWPFALLINGKNKAGSVMPGEPYMANFPIPLLSERKPVDKFAFPRHARMANLILPLLSGRKPFSGSIFPRHAHMANFPLPLVLKSKAEGAGGQGRSLMSRLFGLPTIIRR